MFNVFLSQKTIADMWNNVPQQAAFYVTTIVVCYILGLLMLWLHFMKQKHGQLSCYDIYLELIPQKSAFESPNDMEGITGQVDSDGEIEDTIKGKISPNYYDI